MVRRLPPSPLARPPESDIARAAGDLIRAMLLIRTYRVRGQPPHFDPLGLACQDLKLADIT